MHKIAYDYSHPVRALLPLKMTEVAAPQVVLSAFLYPSNRPERGLMLSRKPDGEFRLLVMVARHNLAHALGADISVGISLKRDVNACDVALTDEDAKHLIHMWRDGIQGMRDGQVGLEMDYIEVGLRSAMPPGVGRDFERYGQYVTDDERDNFVRAIRTLMATDLRDSDRAEERLTLSVREVIGGVR